MNSIGSTVLGDYNTYCAVSEYFFSYSEILNGRKFFKRIPAKKNGFHATATRNNMKIERIEDILPILIRAHERVHHNQLLSSVYGSLLWRLYHHCYLEMGFIVGKLNETELQYSCFIPLFDWYNSDKFKEIYKVVPKANMTFLKNIYKEYGKTEEDYKKEYPLRLKNAFQDLDLFLCFLELIQTNKRMKMNDFLEIANETFRILSIMDDMEAKIEWKSYSNGSANYLPPMAISANEMLEIDARILQLLILGKYQIEPHEAQRFINLLFSDDNLGNKTNILAEQLGGLINIRFAVDVAINTPIDLSCYYRNSGILYVEDILPQWRLYRIQNTFRTSKWFANLSNHIGKKPEIIQNALWKDIAINAKIPPPIDALELSFKNKFQGPNANKDMDLFEIKKEEHPSYLIDKYLIKEFKRGFQIRLQDSLALLIPKEDNIEIFEPLIEFFNDNIILTKRVNEPYWYALSFLAFLKFVSFSALNELFFNNGNASNIERYYRLFNELDITSRVHDKMRTERGFFFNPKSFFRETLGTGLCEKFQWIS